MDLPQPAAAPDAGSAPPAAGVPVAATDPAVSSETVAGAGGDRLWTPWRMRYVGGGASEPGCLFCNRLAADDDVRSLILHRGERVFAIANLFPYNTGHLMIVPNAHVPGPEDADPAALAEGATLLATALRALRRALGCDGFNVGINVGAVAGAGVAEHLHQHVVPRWEGDANFMPVLASTMVLPELIPITYAKVRAEFARETGAAPAAVVVVLGADDGRVLMETRDGVVRLPVAVAGDGEALWRVATRWAGDLAGAPAVPAGWAGAGRAAPGEAVALAVRVEAGGEPIPGCHWLLVSEATDPAGGPDAAVVRRALAHLAPAVAAPPPNG